MKFFQWTSKNHSIAQSLLQSPEVAFTFASGSQYTMHFLSVPCPLLAMRASSASSSIGARRKISPESSTKRQRRHRGVNDTLVERVPFSATPCGDRSSKANLPSQESMQITLTLGTHPSLSVTVYLVPPSERTLGNWVWKTGNGVTSETSLGGCSLRRDWDGGDLGSKWWPLKFRRLQRGVSFYCIGYRFK